MKLLRPSNPHGLTARLTVWDANARSRDNNSRYNKEYSKANNLSLLFLFDAYFVSLQVWGPNLPVFLELFFKTSRFACDAGWKVWLLVNSFVPFQYAQLSCILFQKKSSWVYDASTPSSGKTTDKRSKLEEENEWFTLKFNDMNRDIKGNKTKQEPFSEITKNRFFLSNQETRTNTVVITMRHCYLATSLSNRAGIYTFTSDRRGSLFS